MLLGAEVACTELRKALNWCFWAQKSLALVSPKGEFKFRPLMASVDLFWGGHLRLPNATARVVGQGLDFDAPVVVSYEFRCVSTLSLWFRTNSVAFRCSRCEFRPLVASLGLFWGDHL